MMQLLQTCLDKCLDQLRDASSLEPEVRENYSFHLKHNEINVECDRWYHDLSRIDGRLLGPIYVQV
jgi:hypothetical protein